MLLLLKLASGRRPYPGKCFTPQVASHRIFPVATHIGGSQMLDLLGKIAHESLEGTKRNIEKLKINNSDDGIVQANGEM